MKINVKNLYVDIGALRFNDSSVLRMVVGNTCSIAFGIIAHVRFGITVRATQFSRKRTS